MRPTRRSLPSRRTRRHPISSGATSLALRSKKLLCSALNDAIERAARDQAGGEEVAGPQVLVAAVAALLDAVGAVDEAAERAAREDRQRGRERQVEADGERERRDAAELDGDGREDADEHEL